MWRSGCIIRSAMLDDMASALAYFDTMRSARTTANLIQGQRDFFGAHGFVRLDRHGMHHGPWSDTSHSDPHRPAPA
ncbi:hypothetical protein JM664_08265 [Rhodobacteraceae bacterium MCCB 386]|nr:hypothetical protein [Roseitranquillus sediminis]